MSRNKDRIRKALEAHGAQDIEIMWLPIGPMVEMQGNEGGWEIEFYTVDEEGYAHDHILGGYNVGEVMNQITAMYPPKAVAGGQ